MLRLISGLLTLLVALLPMACAGPTAERPATTAAAPPASIPADSVPIPYGPPAVIAHVDEASYDSLLRGENRVAFTDSIDQRITAAEAAEAAALLRTPGGRAGCEFWNQMPDSRLDNNECCNDWSPWRTEFCALSEFVPATADKPDNDYPQPVPLPNAAGRQLFLAGSGTNPIVLLEFQGARYRARVLGQRSMFGGISHKLYRHPDAELLVLENCYGAMGAGRGSSGQALTWLQVYDLRRDQWLFSALVGWTEEHHGYTEEDGTEIPSSYFDASRAFAVRDQGRTIVLKHFRISADDLTDADTTLRYQPAGTYRLRQGQYRR